MSFCFDTKSINLVNCKHFTPKRDSVLKFEMYIAGIVNENISIASDLIYKYLSIKEEGWFSSHENT